MKHIDVRFYFIKEILDEGDIDLKKIHTKKNPADAYQGYSRSEA